DGLGPLITFRHRSVPMLNLCFTPLRAVYDLTYRERLLARGRMTRLLGLLSETAFRVVDRAAWRNFAAVTCISQTIRDRVASAGLYPRDRLEIVHPGVGAAAINVSGTFERFFLLPGRIMWTKNIELAISAFKLFLDQAPAELRNFRLHIAGGVDRKSVP